MVVFDLDDTLHMRAAPFGNAVIELYDITDRDRVKTMFADFRTIGVEYFHQWDAGVISEQEMYIRRTIDTFALYGYSLTEEESAVFHKTYEKYLQQIRPAEGIAEALQAAAAAGVRLGILTNGSPVRQRNKIRALGLTRWIPEENIVVSLELGVHKPDPEVFRRYREKLEDGEKSAGTAAGPQDSDWWYVGDLYEHDIEPAIKAGWHTIWMVHENEDRKVKHDLEPDRIVRSGKELEKALLEIADQESFYSGKQV